MQGHHSKKLRLTHRLVRSSRPPHPSNPCPHTKPLQPPPSTLLRASSQRVPNSLNWHITPLRRHPNPASNANPLNPIPLTPRNPKTQPSPNLNLQLPIRLHRKPLPNRRPPLLRLLRISHLPRRHNGQRRRIQNRRPPLHHL